MKIEFYQLGTVEDSKLKYAVIYSTYKEEILLVKHKDRSTWEIPGGRREENEDINATGNRELLEETGALEFNINPICEYSVEKGEVESYGRLFTAKIYELGELPNLEISEVKLFDKLPMNLTYPDIQPALYRRAKE
ncbi:NUDIX domain-containing protein [Alkaliphilus pronyensis]|uniref:NUDIX domain-containing protein n=1 Tax=Alkaliphilus pronyensis TaxID=1482732 RepID=A0A6I0F0Q1_9FIRM|nr:NUDIX domain-containing protein [Alkaliphilus pronyensis]KAB3535898.1 NUDIX domain-containing protein [Alkaliphilus pronyensis]